MGGNSEGGTTESKVAAILPVALDITMVAEESCPDLMARDDAITVIGDWPASDKPSGDLGGVG